MIFKLLTFVAIVKASPGTQLMEDPLHGDHAPEIVFQPISGTPAVLEEKRLAQTDIRKGEDEPVHVEQMVGYKEQPINEGQNGFVVEGITK